MTPVSFQVSSANAGRLCDQMIVQFLHISMGEMGDR